MEEQVHKVSSHLTGARLGSTGLVKRARVAKLSAMPFQRTQDSLAPTSPSLPIPHSGFLFNTPNYTTQ